MAEGDRAPRPVGLTRDAGWEIGVSRTVDAPVAAVWAWLTSAPGQAVWLAPGVALPFESGAGAVVVGPSGARAELRSVRRHDRIRLRWQPPGSPHASTVQVALRPAPGGGGERTMVRFHQEHLRSAAEREDQRDRWRVVLEQLAAEVTG